MKKTKKYAAIVLAFIFVLSSAIQVFSQNKIDDRLISTDDAIEFLTAAGVPPVVIYNFTEAQKLHIAETLADEEYVFFESYSIEFFNFTDEGEQISIGELMITTVDGIRGEFIHVEVDSKYEYIFDAADIAAITSFIPVSELSISVVGFHNPSQAAPERFSIFPSFFWHNSRRISNDVFVASLSTDWVLAPQGPGPGTVDPPNLRIHTSWAVGNLRTTDIRDGFPMSLHGVTFRIPTSFGNFWLPDGGAAVTVRNEGHAVFRVDRLTSNALRRVRIGYANDTSLLGTSNISVSVGPLSVSFGGSNFRYAATTLNF